MKKKSKEKSKKRESRGEEKWHTSPWTLTTYKENMVSLFIPFFLMIIKCLPAPNSLLTGKCKIRQKPTSVATSGDWGGASISSTGFHFGDLDLVISRSEIL